MEKDEYWMCIIGPAKRSELEVGADGPMRFVVKERFGEVVGREADSCWSGWGVSEKKCVLLLSCWNMEEAELAALLKQRNKLKIKKFV
jgi:hypothetical protein